jgi:pimeloyl-ACP methyl ester carboxylesterase
MGQDLAGATFGAGGGIPLVFIHGFPLDGRMWECQQAPFSEERRVLVPDLRGFGRSPLPEKQNTIEDHARDLALFLEMHNVTRAILCGFSMGGYVALAFASLFPWKMAGLVLADTRASADPDSAKVHRTTSAQRALSEGMCFLADEMLFKLLTEETLHAGEGELPRKVWNMMVDQRREGMAKALVAMRDRPSRLEELNRICCPTLVVVGGKDAITPPSEARSMTSSIPGARYAEIARAGHLACMEQPEAFNKALENFLREGKL